MSTLHFIKGDSQENWGAMKLTLKKNANVSRLIWQTSQDGWTCVSAKEFNAWRKKNTAQQSMHPTSGSLHVLQADSTPQPLATSQALSTPPTCG